MSDESCLRGVAKLCSRCDLWEVERYMWVVRQAFVGGKRTLNHDEATQIKSGPRRAWERQTGLTRARP